MSKLCIECKHWDGVRNTLACCERIHPKVGVKHSGMFCDLNRSWLFTLFGLIGCGPWGRYWEARDDR